MGKRTCLFACGRERVVDEKDLADVLFGRLMQRSQQSHLSYGLTGVSISVQINLDDMLKNKMLMFDTETGFIAERIHFSGTRNSQWCLTDMPVITGTSNHTKE